MSVVLTYQSFTYHSTSNLVLFDVYAQRDKKHLEESLAEVKEQEEEMLRANRALTTRLEDVQVSTKHFATQAVAAEKNNLKEP